MQQILPQVYTFTGLIAGRVYALQDDDGFTLIDASISGAHTKILSQLQAQGHSPNSVKRVLITHAHPDHVGSLSALQTATGAQVYCHPLEQPIVQGEIAVPMPTRGLTLPPVKVSPTPVDHTLADGDVLPILGGLQALHTPGHASGHMAYWHPERRMAFIGDVIFNLVGMTLPFPFVTLDMNENKRSVQKLLALQPDVLMFGHGNPIVGEAHVRLAAFAKRIGGGA